MIPTCYVAAILAIDCGWLTYIANRPTTRRTSLADMLEPILVSLFAAAVIVTLSVMLESRKDHRYRRFAWAHGIAATLAIAIALSL